jgi:hypothetical protein
MIIERSDSTFVRSSTLPLVMTSSGGEDATSTYPLVAEPTDASKSHLIKIPPGPATSAKDANVRELAIHRRVSRMNYSRWCAEASAVKAYQKRGMPLATGMEIGLMHPDGKWILNEMPWSLM